MPESIRLVSTRLVSTRLELTVLAVPDCPSAPVLDERLARALSGRAPVTITRHVVDTEADAARLGMHGSPTLLVNSVDMFAAPGTTAGVSCRLYRDEAGPSGGAPSVAALREALDRASDDPVPAALAQAVDRAGLGRIAPVQGGLRAVHQRVLRVFAETGVAPRAGELEQTAAAYGVLAERVLAQLHAGDFLRLDAGGRIRAAYPFSAEPTAHRVSIDGGPRVFAMCAIDALGMAAMLGRDVRISSLDPCDGRPVTVEVAPAGQARWAPVTAVVFAGQQEACQPYTPTTAPLSTEPPTEASRGASSGASWGAAEMCCGSVNFFGDQQGALTWAAAHPQVSGQLLDQQAALEMGVAIFGPLQGEPVSEPRTHRMNPMTCPP